MKLDKLAFAKVLGHCVSNGFSAGDWEIEHLDQLIDIEIEQPKAGVVPAASVDNLLMLMAEGTRKIEAIKAYRVLTGEGLKEAKDAVERYWVSKGHFVPPTPPLSQFGN